MISDFTYEDGLISGLLYAPDKIKLVSDWLFPRDFLDPFFKQVYAAMLTLDSQGAPNDLVCIASLMQPFFPNENVLGQLAVVSASKMNMDVNYYGGKIVESRKRRDLDSVLTLAKAQNQENKPFGEILDLIDSATQDLYVGTDVPKGHELAQLWLNIAQDKDDQIAGKKTLRIMTHYPALDAILEGFREGNLVTIAAGSGVGKTTFGLNILRNVAIKDKIPVMLLSLEMSGHEIGMSTLAAYKNMAQTTLKSDRHEDRLTTLELAANAGIEITSHGVKFKVYCESLEKFGSAVRTIRAHVKAVPDCKLIMIDYVGLMSVESSKSAKDMIRAYEIGHMTRTLKNLAMELGVVMLILAQTNRSNSMTENPIPTLKSLRDSSSLAHDANMVLFIHADQEQPNAKIIVAKNRNGPTGTAMLGYDRSRATFFNLGSGSGNEKYSTY